MSPKIEYRDRIDHKILFILASLIAFGLVMIYSVASSQNNMMLFYKQVACLGSGFVLMWVFQRNDFSFLGRKILAIPLYFLAIAMICALLLPAPITVTVNGATRWLNFVFVRFQVAEFVKIALLIALASLTQYAKFRKGPMEEFFYIILVWFLGTLPAALLLIISNDLSSAMVVMGITFIMSFVGSRGKVGWILHILAVLFVVGVVAYAIYYVSNHMPTEQQLLANEVSFRIGRVAAWLAPEKYAGSTGFQPLHCLYAIANGGWFGKGLGQSWQKAILPESENDVIFAIVIEEMGIFGGLVLLFLFIVLVTLLCRVALGSKTLYGKMICTGIAAHIMLQVIIHCGVCTNLIPNTGIGLPFISSGMTAGFLLMAEMALALSVAHVYIFDKYDMSRMRVQDKVRYKKQKFFTGKAYLQKQARLEARDKASELAKQNAVETRQREESVKREQARRADSLRSAVRQTPGSGVSRSYSSSRHVSSTSRGGAGRYSSSTGRSGAGRYSSSTSRSDVGRYHSSTSRSDAGRISRADQALASRRSGAGMYSRYAQDRGQYSSTGDHAAGRNSSLSAASVNARRRNRSIYSPGYFDNNEIPVYGSRSDRRNPKDKNRPRR